MEAILMSNGKYLKPSCSNFYANYKSSWTLEHRGYISERFYNLSLKERLDVFEIYFEFYFRQIYKSYMNNDNKMSIPRIDETTHHLFIYSDIEGSSSRFAIFIERERFKDRWGMSAIQLAIVDDAEDYIGYQAAIGFNYDELLRNKDLENLIIERIQRVCKSIVELSPEMATWYLLQGINLISDAFNLEKGDQ